MKRKSVLEKTAAAAITAALAMAFVTGCSSNGSDNANAGSVTADGRAAGTTGKTASGKQLLIRVCWWGNQTRNDETVKALDMYTADHPDVKFEVEFSDWSGYWDKLATQAAGGNLPDIIQMDYAYIRQYTDKGQLTGLKQYIDSNRIDTKDIPHNIMVSGEINGDVYGICSGTNAKALLVNTDVMEEAGITLPRQPTYDEFFQASRTVFEKTGKQIQIPSNDEQSMLFIARSMGQTMFTEDGKALGMPDETAALRYFTMLKDTLDGGYHVSPEAIAEASASQQSMFAAGKTWCGWENSNQIVNEIEQCKDGLNWDIHMYPTMKDAKQQPLFLKPSMFYSITKDSQNPDIAADVINYLTNSIEANRQALVGERGVPISGAVAEAINSVVDETTARVNTYVSNAAKVAAPIDPPFPPASAEIGKNISDLSDAVRYGEMTPQEAAHEFYEKSTELLKKGAES